MSDALTQVPAPSSQARTEAALGWAWGAVTIVNATATGVGCALAVEGATTARWAPRASTPATGTLIDAVRAQLGRLPGWTDAMQLHVEAAFPPSRGLKTSSSVAAAALRAGRAALALSDDDAWVIQQAVAASRDAGVTLTGALDDQVATVIGGCHLTDNNEGRVLHSAPTRAWDVAIWVPEASIAKAEVARLATKTIYRDIEEASEMARAGDLPGAMTANGTAYTRLYEAAGLPVTAEPAQVALRAGAEGAGLSGTGPAVAALFRPGLGRVDLRPVRGGQWTWTRAVR